MALLELRFVFDLFIDLGISADLLVVELGDNCRQIESSRGYKLVNGSRDAIFHYILHCERNTLEKKK